MLNVTEIRPITFRGVPQSSILRPLIFLIYINDLNNCTTMSVVRFADESTLYIIGASFDSLIRKTYFGLGKIDNWL